MKTIAVLFAIASIIVYLMVCKREWKKHSNIALIEPNDFEVAQAKLQAQASLDKFRQLMEQNPDFYASVKAALPTGVEGEFEHIWIETLTPGSPDTPWHGILANEPIDLPGLTLGSEVSFPESAIEDWMVEMEDESIEGGFSFAAMKRG